MRHCYFNPLLLIFSPLLGSFTHCLFSHCAEALSRDEVLFLTKDWGGVGADRVRLEMSQSWG